MNDLRLEVSVDDQLLRLFRGDELVRTFVISTARKGVGSTPGTVEPREGFPCMVASPTVFGEVTGLPRPEDGTVYVVSGMVGAALAGWGRRDVYMPGTGPSDGARRNEAGHISGVTRLVAVS